MNRAPTHLSYECGGRAAALDQGLRTGQPLLAVYLPAGYPDPSTILELQHCLVTSADIPEGGRPDRSPDHRSDRTAGDLR